MPSKKVPSEKEANTKERYSDLGEALYFVVFVMLPGFYLFLWWHSGAHLKDFADIIFCWLTLVGFSWAMRYLSEGKTSILPRFPRIK